MIFEIDEIIENEELHIKLLSYNNCKIETLDMNWLSSGERNRLNSFGANKRKLEYYFTRYLWRSFPVHQKIYYSESGKPYIKNGFISISHSSNTVAISYSDQHPIGLDIEHFNLKITRVQDKFLSENEKNRFDLSNLENITTLWSIKEAVYKLLDIEGLSFKEDIEVLKIGTINKVKVATGGTEKEFTFSRILFDAFILIYCTDTY